MSAVAYQPSTALRHKVARRLTPLMARRSVEVRLARPVVCFTFDDAPASVIENALPLMEARGWKATVYVSTGLIGQETHHGRMMKESEIGEVAARGHEIGAHGHTHTDPSVRPVAEVEREARINRATFARLGVPEPVSYAWPYGQTRADLKRAMSQHYTSLRGISSATHRRRVDLNQVGSWKLFSSTVGACLRELDRVEKRPGLMTLFTHDVREDCSEWGCSPDDFARVVKRVEEMDADVVTVGEAVGALL